MKSESADKSSTGSQIQTSAIESSGIQSLKGNRPSSLSSICSTKSRDSMGSVGFGQSIIQNINEDQTIQYRAARLIQIIEIDKQPCFPCYDAVVLLLTCKNHQKVAIKNFFSTSKIFWLPFMANISNRLHSETLQKMLYALLQSHDGGLVPTRTLQEINYSTQLIDIVCVENQYGVWSKRYTYWTHIRECVKDVCSQDHNSKIEWRPIDSVLANASHAWGRDMLRLIEKVKSHVTGSKAIELPFDIREFAYQANFPSGILDHKYDTDSPSDPFISLFQSAKLNAPKLKDLYKDYRKQTYPSLDMNYPCLEYYLHKYGFNTSTCGFAANFRDKVSPLRSLFHSALLRPGKTKEDPEFGFSNLCYIVLAMDPNCGCDYVRAWLLFNMYSNNSSSIDSGSAKMLAQDIGTNIPVPSRFDFGEFQKIYYDSRYQKLQAMIRFKRSIFDQIDNADNVKNSNDRSLTSRRENQKHGQGTCESCKANNYAMSTHTYMVNQDGQLANQRPVELERIENLNEFARYSREMTNYERSLPNLVRSFLSKNDDNMNFYGLLIIQLCENLEHLLGKKAKIVKVRSPTIVLPELHGNFDYLRTIEKEFAPLRPENETGMIFLGNFIGSKDKQTRSVDVIAYLFAMKLLEPNRIVLLRGLQESSKTIPKLMKECNQKFESIGEQVCNAIVSVLESLPYVAIVNETICCLPSCFPKEAAKTSLFHFFETISSSSVHVTRDVLTQFCKSRPSETLTPSSSRVRSKPSNRSRKSTTRKPNSKQHKSSQTRSRSLVANSVSLSNAVTRRKSVPNIDENTFYQFLTNNQFNHLIRSGDASESFSIGFNKRCFTLAASEIKGNGIQSQIMSIDGALNMKCISFTFDPVPRDEGVRRTHSCVDF